MHISISVLSFPFVTNAREFVDALFPFLWAAFGVYALHSRRSVTLNLAGSLLCMLIVASLIIDLADLSILIVNCIENRQIMGKAFKHVFWNFSAFAQEHLELLIQFCLFVLGRLLLYTPVWCVFGSLRSLAAVYDVGGSGYEKENAEAMMEENRKLV
ncbi:MAG: hypothetical protein KVP17_003054 [Porospora cf. gigantea B]|uniref:uncharacterized protein n=1 Tax=Porospora cf. gigantea B TaxID=2853592 RepID=UPI003571E3C8|nr:MAG: hypothetical protein KVP17_003054 [Porospora cf. gigantea B]